MAYGDNISRQAAIMDAESWVAADEYEKHLQKNVVEWLKEFPPAQPTQLTDDDIETIRIHLSAFKENLCNQHRWNEAKEYEALIDRLTAQPGQRTGKWIPKDGRYHCDQCGGIAPKGIRWDFCPHCGAKMEGDAE